MEDITDSEKFAFQEDLIRSKVLDILSSNLGDTTDYDESKCEQWQNNILEDIIQELHQTKKPFKYAVTCLIQQRTGQAIHSATSQYWDTVSDAQITVTWPKTKRTREDTQQGSIQSIVTVAAISFYPSQT